MTLLLGQKFPIFDGEMRNTQPLLSLFLMPTSTKQEQRKRQWSRGGTTSPAFSAYQETGSSRRTPCFPHSFRVALQPTALSYTLFSYSAILDHNTPLSRQVCQKLPARLDSGNGSPYPC